MLPLLSDCGPSDAADPRSTIPRPTPSPTKSPCWPPSPRLRCAASSPPGSAPASACDGYCETRPPASAPRPWDDGTTHLILTPHELLEKLAALVPPPRVNLIRYHGLLASSARDPDKVVPPRTEAEPPGEDSGCGPHHRSHRLAWAALLARVFSHRRQPM